ncbi:MAG: hypothetical protein DMF74_24375 [Acidobacteria bacterium]|nr:MAG: hypothetical protein DMF74_24375 [Acidobacteriota bacterium]
MQTSDEILNNPDLEFLKEDYWRKVEYLKDHFTRLWNRFNYFLTLEAALFGATILSSEKYHWWVPIFGAVVCVLWYIFGAQDRYLVELYRKEIEQALDQLGSKLSLENYYFVGQTENIEDQKDKMGRLKIDWRIYQWRWSFLSTTKLPALFPLIVLLMWAIIFLVLINKR